MCIRDRRDYLKVKYDDLVRWSDDPSAGFLRFHITEYVEAQRKFSPELTDWLPHDGAGRPLDMATGGFDHRRP